MPAPDHQEMAKRNRTLTGIAIFKLFKVGLLTAIGIASLQLLNGDPSDVARDWISLLHLDPTHQWVNQAFFKILGVEDSTLRKVSAGSFLYALMFMIEGLGLMMQKRWAEYLTAVITASLLPIEIYELWKQVSAAKVVITVINLAILVYLLRHLWIHRGDARKTTARVRSVDSQPAKVPALR